MSLGSFTTELCWEDADGNEVEASVRVLYSRHNAYPETLEDIGCEAAVEIISITPADPTIRVPERFETDDDLMAECMADWAAEKIDAAEWRAQCRRDDLLMERF
ncbi:hypothetical protein [Sphingomonas xinjiangensis]|uniref:Uncharacterized protein n=1 Tax=Sphingomonas xinjiangensis TaxID=643568 RepID=A0A840YJX4_9SPHN|nr:hypothetical protein [Sphingomonas xinjiangensis]MBB5709296.1 hypothetical protein [Sphingomonas xinjiangensis]